MSKKRIIGTLVLRDGIVVQSMDFERYLPVGSPVVAAKFLDAWGVDEITLLDITARQEGRRISTKLIDQIAQVCHVPLTAGGGICNIEDVRTIIRSGADKVAVNQLIFDDPAAVQKIAENFGVQCVVASLDARPHDGDWHAYINSGRIDTGLTISAAAEKAVAAGAGEILINAIERDGTGNGYDLDLITTVAQAVDVPVIAQGGAGHPDHMITVLSETPAAAVAAANFLHFTEHSVATIKSRARQAGLDIRADSEADYSHATFSSSGRVTRREEDALLREVFEFISEEVI